MTGTIAALRDRSEITMVPPDQWPEQNAVGEGLAKLGK